MTSQKRGLAVECSSKRQQQFQVLGFFGDEFHEGNLHLRGQSFGE